MKSLKQITRQYIAMLKQGNNSDPVDKNRVNCYTCRKCKHITKTIDRDTGVTPFVVNCERCNGEAQSSFYIDIAPNQDPTFEWYRPSVKEIFKKDRKNDGRLSHVLSGGLKNRRIK